MTRGTTLSRFMTMGYFIGPGEEAIGEIILEMHLRGITSRPTIEKIAAVLAYEYERRFGPSPILDTD